jgi:MFS family permease
MATRSPIKLRAELPVLIALFLDLAAFGMVFPDVQLHARNLGASGPLIGALLASMFVVQLVASPPWGSLSDRVGRKPIFLFCTALSACSWLVYGMSTNLWLILLSRVLAGLAAANVVVGQAYLADITSEDERSGVMGRVGAAISSGLILGPAIGMQIATRGSIQTLGVVAASCSGVAVLCGLLMQEPKQKEKRAPGKWLGMNFSLIRDNPKLGRLLLLATVAWFALATLEGTFGRLVTEHFRWHPTVFGNIFSMESLLGAIVQGVLLVPIVKVLHESWTIRLGFFLAGMGLLLTPFAPAVWVLFAVSGIYSIGTGLANPTVNSAASRQVPENRQGELFGLMQGARSIGFVVGPSLGGALFDWRPAAPYVLAGVIALAAALLIPKGPDAVEEGKNAV